MRVTLYRCGPDRSITDGIDVMFIKSVDMTNPFHNCACAAAAGFTTPAPPWSVHQ
jgi:hypothetical protein